MSGESIVSIDLTESSAEPIPENKEKIYTEKSEIQDNKVIPENKEKIDIKVAKYENISEISEKAGNI